MTEQPIDLRSDAVTQPTEVMREAMRTADIGRYLDHEDPTVLQLEQRCADRFAKEAAVFLPSATMANLIACIYYCNPGEQAIVDADSHVFLNEFSGMARVGGILPRALPRKGALPDIDSVTLAISHRKSAESPVRLLWVENSHNVGGGAVAGPEALSDLRDAIAGLPIAIHVDGARIFNAAVSQRVPLAELSENVDSISVGFNKGLACPVGCVLVGSHAMIEAALQLRRMLGGRFTKGGVLAAACIVAIDSMVDRLAEDHANAQALAQAIESVPGLRIESPVTTNIVRFDTSELCPALDLVSSLGTQGVLVGAVAPTIIRAVTHLDFSRDQIPEVTSALHAAAESLQLEGQRLH